MCALKFLQEYSNVLIAFFACSTFLLSLIIHLKAKKQHEDIQELLTNLTVAQFMGGPHSNETEAATTLFIAHKENYMKNIKK